MYLILEKKPKLISRKVWTFLLNKIYLVPEKLMIGFFFAQSFMLIIKVEGRYPVRMSKSNWVSIGNLEQSPTCFRLRHFAHLDFADVLWFDFDFNNEIYVFSKVNFLFVESSHYIDFENRNLTIRTTFWRLTFWMLVW